ncbi:MAG: tetratricopeptide repeat protein [Candidatus Latescibacterota bacterium]
MMAILVPTFLALLVVGSQLVTNPEDMTRAFERAQKLLAGGDFAGAGRLYEELLGLPDAALLHASRVRVTIDEREVGLQQAARYQLANIARKQAQLWQKEAELADSLHADSLQALTRTSLRQAAERFTVLREEAGFELRETAAYLVIECRHEAQDYQGSVEAARRLLALFPAGKYAARARYTLGWAHFELKEYEAAAAVFRAYVAADSGSIRADRARLQLGLALEALERWEEALAAFTALAEAYDPTAMTEDQRTAVELAGLREGQSRRSLCAKAWIKRGDVLKAQGRHTEALAAYRKVGEAFPEEEGLAETAWVRQALLARQAEGADAAVAVYRYASEQAPRLAFRARMQAGLMTVLFEEGRYAEALAAHRLYLDVYGPDTGEAGVSPTEARFRIAECQRLLGEAAPSDSGRTLLSEAVAGYGAVLAQGEGYLVPEALYWQGQVWQRLGEADSARAAYARVYEGQAPSEVGCRALLEVARLSAGTDTLYQQLLDMCPGQPQVQGLAALELGHRRRLQGRLAEAESLLARVPADQPQHVPSEMERAQVRVQQGQVRQARQILEAVLGELGEAEAGDQGIAAQALGSAAVTGARGAGGARPDGSGAAALSGPDSASALTAGAGSDTGAQSGLPAAALAAAVAAAPSAAAEAQAGRPDSAAAYDRAALRAQVQAQLGLLWQKEDDHARALGLLTAALPRLTGELRVAARFGIGWSCFQQGRYAQAWSEWRAALREEAMAPEQRRPFLRGLGLCARELKDEAGALALYREMIADPQTEAEGRLGLAQYHLDSGAGRPASAAVRPLLEDPRPEVALQAHLLEGKALLAQEQPAQARTVLRAGLARAPDDAGGADFHFELGSAALGLQDYAAAVQAFTAALRGATRRELRAASLYYLGHALRAAGDSTGAAQRFTTLVSDYGDQSYAPEGAFLLGEMRYSRADYPGALDWYTRVFSRWPASAEAPEALYGAAWCQLEQHQEEGMRTLFLRLAHEHPRHPRAQQGLLHLGDYYYNEAKFAKATELYRQVVERFPQTSEAIQAEQVLVALSDVAADSLYQVGMRHFDAGEYAQAIGLLEQVVVQYPHTPSEAAARCNIGVAYQLMLEYRKAAEAYRQAIEALADRKEEWRALAFARENLGWIARHVLDAEVKEVLARP